MKKVAIGVAAAVLLGIGAVSGAALYAQHEAERQIAQSFARLPPGVEGRHGAVSYSLLADRLAIADIAYDKPGQPPSALRAARLEMRGINRGLLGALLSGGSGGEAWRVGSIVADDLAYDSAGYRQSVERVVLEAPRLELAGEAPPEQWSLAQWIAALSWSSAEATNFRASAEPPAAGVAFSMSGASRSFAALKAGRLEGSVDKDLVADLAAPQGRLHVEIAEARASDVDLLAWDKIFDPANYRAGERDPTLRVLCGGLGVAKLTASLDEGALSLSLDALSLAGMKMRQWPFPPNAAPRAPTPAQALGLMQSFALDGIELDGLSVNGPRFGSGSLVLGRLALKLGEHDRVDHAEIDDVSIKLPETSFALGALELDGLAFQLPDELLTTDPQDQAGRPTSLPRFFVEHYRLANVSFEHKSVGEVSLQELEATMSGSLEKPTGTSFEMQRLGLDLAALGDSPAARVLGALGYGRVFFTARGSAVYDIDARTLELSRFTFGAPEMGQVRLFYHLGNYPAEWNTADQRALLEQAMNIVIDGFELRYDDASLAERVLAVLAAKAHEAPAALRQRFILALERQQSLHADEPQVLATLDALIGFLREPKSIRIVAQPPDPVTPATLLQGGLGADLLLTRLGAVVDLPP